MATWITHLRIADLILEKASALDKIPFIVGSIAPDSGTLNPDRFSYSPPRRILHWTSEDGRTIYFDDFAKQYLTGEAVSQSAYSFYFGYYTHLLTDDVWANRAYRPLRKQYDREIVATNREFIWRIKKSWYDLDRLYLRDHTVASFEILKGVRDFDGRWLDYITPEMINTKIAELSHAYDDLSFTPETEYVFMTEKCLDGIIGEIVETALKSSYAARIL